MNKILLTVPAFVSLILLWTACEKAPSSLTTNDTSIYNGVEYNNINGISIDTSSLFDFRDSTIYPIVQIANQCWMAENLRYNAVGSWVNNARPSATYGRLYDWETVMNGESTSNLNPSDVQGICPKGWHLPSDLEWNALEITLGMNSSDATTIGYRGTHGTEMKSVIGWSNSGNGSNSSGFNAFPAGHKLPVGFDELGAGAYFWTSTENLLTHAWYRALHRGSTEMFRNYTIKEYGLSCRCLKN